jgi:ubiquinone biosynthesis protein UbiJ
MEEKPMEKTLNQQIMDSITEKIETIKNDEKIEDLSVSELAVLDNAVEQVKARLKERFYLNGLCKGAR